MRRVPSVNPEELRALCKQLAKHRGDGPLNHTNNVALCVRFLEARQFGLDHARLLPEFVRKFVFRLAATRPLESDLTEMIEEVIASSTRGYGLQNPTQPVIL